MGPSLTGGTTAHEAPRLRPRRSGPLWQSGDVQPTDCGLSDSVLRPRPNGQSRRMVHGSWREKRSPLISGFPTRSHGLQLEGLGAAPMPVTFKVDGEVASWGSCAVSTNLKQPERRCRRRPWMPGPGRRGGPSSWGNFEVRSSSKGQIKMPSPTLPRYLAKVPCPWWDLEGPP